MINDLDHATLRRSFNLCLAAAGFAIDGTNTENVQTANAVTVLIDGVFNAVGVQAEIDLSALAMFDGDGNALDAAPVLADGYEAKHVVAVDASDTFVLLCGFALPTSQGDDTDWPQLPDGYAPIGGLKVVNASGSDFVIGTTPLDDAGITDTYYDIGIIPPRSI